MSDLQSFQTQLIEESMTAGALKFGTFTLKSGRQSPYFFNAGLLSTGKILSIVATAYANTITAAPFAKDFDVLFGPAYKGIGFAACTALALSRDHDVQVDFAYNRKEAKDHGEGGVLVGTDVKGKRVLVLDDVMTSGLAVRQSIEIIKNAGGTVVGVVQLLDRQEVGEKGGSTAVEMEAVVGKGRVQSILKMKDLMSWLQKAGKNDELDKMKAYYDQYGFKG